MRSKMLLDEFRDVFSNGDSDFGVTVQIEHRIDITDVIPIRVPYRWIPDACLREVKEHFQWLTKKEIIRPR